MAQSILTDAEIQSFSEKLRTFGETLTPKERLVFASILLDPSDDEDVVGPPYPRGPKPESRAVVSARTHAGSALA